MFKLCDLKNISLSFGNKAIFDGAEIAIHEGDRIGILGLNGKGKSSLFKIIAEKVTPDTSTPPFLFSKARKKNGSNFDFSVFLIPQEIVKGDIKYTEIQKYIFNFYPKLDQLFEDFDKVNQKIEEDCTDKVLDQQKEILDQIEHLQGWELTRNYESYLKLFKINDFSKNIHELSGGEQKKVLLALGLSCTLPIILWDEPTNHLDLETIKLLEEEIKGLNSTHLVVSHDRYFLSEVTNKVSHIQHGKIINFDGGYTQYLEHLANEEVGRLALLEKLKNNLRREDAWMKQGIKARGTRSKKRVEGFHKLHSDISQLKSLAHKKMELALHDSMRKTKSLVQGSDICFSYPDKDIFKHIDFSINKGDKIGMVGRNGEGKTTLINLILEKIKASSGTFKKADTLSIQYFSQSREKLNSNETPFELLGSGTDFVSLPNGTRKHVVAYFESFLFHRDEIHRPLSTFSGGEKSRLQLAINLLVPGDLLIFDEPTNDLDLETIQILEKSLAEFPGSLLLVSHDRAFLAEVTNKVWLLQNNQLEKFEAGYSQVEEYLELSIMEGLLNQQDTEKKITKQLPNENKATPEKTEVPHDIGEQIKSLETEIEQISKLTSQLSTNAGDQESLDLLAKLSKKQSSLEERLLELYDLMG